MNQTDTDLEDGLLEGLTDSLSIEHVLLNLHEPSHVQGAEVGRLSMAFSFQMLISMSSTVL